MPDAPDVCVAIREYGGYAPEHTFGTDVIFEKPTIQKVARAGPDDYQAARLKAEACYVASFFTNQTLSGVRYLRSEAIHSPLVIKRDANNRWEIGFSVLCYKERSAA